MKVLLHFPAGDLAATGSLARELLERGHEVAYTAIDNADLQGLPSAVKGLRLHRRWPMRALLEGLHGAQGEERDWLRLEIETRVARDYYTGEVLEAVAAHAPDVIVADSAPLSPLQFVAHRLRRPCLQLSLTLGRRWSAAPPLNSSLRADASAVEIAGARWESSCLNRVRLGTPMPLQLASDLERLAFCTDYPRGGISFAAALAPALTLQPEVMLGESSLEFDSAGAEAGQHLALGLPELPGRGEPQMSGTLANFVVSGDPLVYIDIEASGCEPAALASVRRVLAAALARETPWKTVIVTHCEATAQALRGVSPQVLAVAHAPRDWMLARATLMITSASLQALRAAIAQQVPMIAIPLAGEQHGNAARIAHHGVGLRLRAELLSADILELAIRTALARRKQMRDQLKRLDAACRAERARGLGCAAVENLAATAARGEPEVPHTLTSAPIDSAAVDLLSESAWFAYACECAERVLQSRATREPDRVAVFRALLRRHGTLLGTGADPGELRELRAQACARAAEHWHRGYGAVVLAMHPQPRCGAQLAYQETLAALAHAAAEGSGSDAERGARFNAAYAATAAELDAAFGRHLERECAQAS